LRVRYAHHADDTPQLEALMRRANPDAAWHERANWMIDITEWIRHQSKVSLLDQQAWRNVKHKRVAMLLDWLDNHRDVRRLVQNSLQKTLREASGPELFSATGLPHEAAFFSELSERVSKWCCRGICHPPICRRCSLPCSPIPMMPNGCWSWIRKCWRACGS